MVGRGLVLVGALVVAVCAPVGVDPAGAAPAIGPVAVGTVAAGVPTTVTAAVVDPDEAGVVLEVRVEHGAVESSAMVDDGTAGDATAGDGTYTGRVPAQTAGTLVRHRVRSGSVASPAPANGRTYAGFVVSPPEVTSAAPVLDWRIAPADYSWLRANPASKEYRPAVLVAGGVVIDGVQVRPQGGVTAQGGPKPNFKFKLPKSLPLGPPFFDERVDEFVMDADYEDPTYSVNVIGNELYGRHGVPPRQVTTTRVQRNGSFHGLYQLIEEMDGDWRSRAGFTIASHYEGESQSTALIDEGGPEALEDRFSLEHPDESDYADLHELAVALDAIPSDQRPAALFDTMDVPQVVDVLAVSAILHNWDTVTGNWALLRDEDTGRWRTIPNDLDLILGLRGEVRPTSVVPGFARGTMGPLFADERFVAMYQRRLRTLLDTELTSARILGRLDENSSGLGPDIALDRETWALDTPSPAAGRAQVADYVADARALLLAFARDGELPAPQASSAGAQVGEIRSTGDAASDFVAVVNPSRTEAVDISGWALTGDAEATFPPGSVIPADDELVVPVSPAAMAARGEGVPVAGRLARELPDAGGTTVLRDADGQSRDTAAWTASADPGGTPGAAGPTASPLVVGVHSGRESAPAGTPFEVRVSVRNWGTSPVPEVVVASSAPACARDVGSLEAGETRSWWCRVVLTSPRTSETVRAEATSAVAEARDRAEVIVTDADTLTLGRPRGYLATAGPGGIRVSYADQHPPPPGVSPNLFVTWRMEAQLWTEDGTSPDSRLVGRNGTFVSGLTPGVPVSLSVVPRSTAAVGTPTVRTPAIAPRPSVLWPFADARSFVLHHYRDLAGRDPSPQELDLWIAAIEGQGVPPARLVADLLATPRWATTATAVARLYTSTLGRAPDAAGLAYWLDRRATGMSLGAMADAFAKSPEFRRAYGSLGAPAFVDRIYRNIFGRSPDAAGEAYWVGRLAAGASRGTVVVGFTQSPEGRTLLGPAAEVDVAWFAITGAAAPRAARADAIAWRAVSGSTWTLVDSIRTRD